MRKTNSRVVYLEGSDIPKLTNLAIEIVLIDEGTISRNEVVRLIHNSTLVVGSAQINYFTNGLKNFAHIERLVVKSEHRQKGYGNTFLQFILEHIRSVSLNFSSGDLTEMIASEIEELGAKAAAASKRGVDRVQLDCAPELVGFYKDCGFVETRNTHLRFDLNELDYSSLD